jgi:transposase
VDTERKADTVAHMDQESTSAAAISRRPRRSFTDEFRAGAVRLVLDQGKTIPQVARDLDLTQSALRTWVERARADRTKGKTGLTTAEREELAKLRKQVRELTMERDILKEAAVLFAKHHR